MTKTVAWERTETDPCERGTTGCCIAHDDSPPGTECETW